MKIKKMLKDVLSEEQLYQLQCLDGSMRQNIKKILPEELMLKRLFKKRMGYPLNLDNPKTFNEKLQWLKLHDRNPLYTTMVDKYEVKKYVAEKIGEQYIIPTLGVWDHFNEIDFDKLPDKFVLKCTHDSGSVVLCKDKLTFDRIDAKRKLERGLSRNFYYNGYEWPYKDVKPRIIAEPYLEDEITKELTDYKIYTFSGKAEIMFIAQGRARGNTVADYFDKDFNHLNLRWGYPNADLTPTKPLDFEEMMALAEKLSKGIPEVRVDFYYVNRKIYFGELTFFDASGFESFEPKEWDYKLGEMIDLKIVRTGC